MISRSQQHLSQRLQSLWKPLKRSGPCAVLLPQAQAGHRDVPKYADFGHVEIGWKNLITRCQEVSFTYAWHNFVIVLVAT